MSSSILTTKVLSIQWQQGIHAAANRMPSFITSYTLYNFTESGSPLSGYLHMTIWRTPSPVDPSQPSPDAFPIDLPSLHTYLFTYHKFNLWYNSLPLALPTAMYVILLQLQTLLKNFNSTHNPSLLSIILHTSTLAPWEISWTRMMTCLKTLSLTMRSITTPWKMFMMMHLKTGLTGGWRCPQK